MEERIYSICNNSVTIEEILERLKLSFDQRQIVKALDALVLAGFVEIIDTQEIEYNKQELERGTAGLLKIEAPDNFPVLYEKFKEVLLTNLPPETTQMYINELETCPNIHKLKYTARKIAIKLKLTMNAAVGEALLGLLD